MKKAASKSALARAKKPVASDGGPLKVKVAPVGLDRKAVDDLSRKVMNHPSVRKQLGRARHRLLSLELVESEEAKGARRPARPTAHRATIYDYSKNRAVVVEGSLDQPRRLSVAESGQQPSPTREEFDAAVRLLAKDPELGPALRAKRLQPYPPMPPLVEEEEYAGRPARTIAVGLLPADKRVKHEIVGVNLVRRPESKQYIPDEDPFFKKFGKKK